MSAGLGGPEIEAERGEAKGMVLGWSRRGWSGGVMRSEKLRAPCRSAVGGVVGRLRVAPGT